MATVRFSNEFRESIINNARRIFTARIKEAEKSVPADWGDRIYEIIFAPYIPTFEGVAPEFLNMQDKFKFIGFKSENYALHDISFEMTLSTPRPFPVGEKLPPESVPFVTRLGYYGNDYKLRDVPEFAEFKQEVIAWRERVKSIRAKQDEFVAAVQKVIDAHTTLAPALKMWPPLWDLVDEEYRVRHREIRDREKKEVAINVDLGSLTAAITAHKLIK